MKVAKINDVIRFNDNGSQKYGRICFIYDDVFKVLLNDRKTITKVSKSDVLCNYGYLEDVDKMYIN